MLLYTEVRMRPGPSSKRSIDGFMPSADINECHEILIHAPAAMVFEVAAHMDLRSVPIVRAIFWLREKLMGAEPVERPEKGLVAETLALGWGILTYRPAHELVMGAVTQPWIANVKFRAIEPEKFVGFNEPDLVKIVWTLEVEAIEETTTLFRTQTRVLATDEVARRKFRRYWLKFGLGIRLIRTLMNRAVRREAEAQHRIRKICGADGT